MDDFSHDAIRKLKAKNDSYTHTVTARSLGEKAHEKGMLFVQEEIELLDQAAGNPITLKCVSTKLCSNGHLLGPDNAPVGVCQVSWCKSVVCVQEGCSYTCRCGRMVCSAHAHVFKDGEVACPRCKVKGWFRRMFW